MPSKVRYINLAIMFLAFVSIFSVYVLWLSWPILRRCLFTSPLDNIPGPASKSWWKGNFGELFNPNAWDFHKYLMENYGAVVRINAVLGDKQLYVYDPKALYHVAVKDQHIYESSPTTTAGNRAFFGRGILSALGEDHRRQRKILNPAFSIAHMREIVPIFYQITHKMNETLTSQLTDGPKEIDVLKWMARAALEIMGQGGLGYSLDPLTEIESDHHKTGAFKEFMPTLFALFLERTYILPSVIDIGPKWFQRLVIGIIPYRTLHRARDLVDTLTDISTSIFEEKKRALKAGDEAVSQRKDVMSILMKANMSADAKDRLEEDELMAQISTIVFAGFDTTSSALGRTLWLLAQHVDIQETLRQEIFTARQAAGGDIPYDELSALPYLDAICRESLRLYPPFSNVVKTANQDITMPLSSPITAMDGRVLHEVFVPKGTYVNVAIYAANRNPEVWGPDAAEWKPDRWLNKLPDTVLNAPNAGVYSHLMTFFGGSRACIGFKFSQLEMKVVLSMLVAKFRFELPKDSDEIYWEMTQIVSPILKNVGRKKHQLPLKMTLVEQEN